MIYELLFYRIAMIEHEEIKPNKVFPQSYKLCGKNPKYTKHIFSGRKKYFLELKIKYVKFQNYPFMKIRNQKKIFIWIKNVYLNTLFQ